MKLITVVRMRGRALVALVAAALAATTLVVGAVPAGAQTAGSHPVGVVTETFVDRSRPTAANRDCAAIKSRTLPTTVYYPASGTPSSSPVTAQPNAVPDTSGGPYPFIVFAHG